MDKKGAELEKCGCNRDCVSGRIPFLYGAARPAAIYQNQHHVICTNVVNRRTATSSYSVLRLRLRIKKDW